MLLLDVLEKGRLAAESLATDGEAALVRAGAGVDALVAGERGRVGEGSEAIFALALVRALAGVGPRVDSQGRALNEALATPVSGATEWSAASGRSSIS